MIDTSKIKKFQNTLENWFNENGRDFPWRSPDASKYEQVLSEILLQRTKAETVAKYYSTFFARFPDWQSLGNATIEELEDVMKPLGLYKHRAKRLYTLAQGIKQRVCNMPANSEEIKETGFAGLYIANAYSLFFLNQRKPLLDVNMSRLLKRVFDPGEFKDVRHDKTIQAIANLIVDFKKCKELNWAILDYAAKICTSKNPLCNNCLLNNMCISYKTSQNELNPLVEEPQFRITLHQAENKANCNKSINVLSLFSGCGGMDLGLEGGFTVDRRSVNPVTNPDFIDEILENNLVRLKKTRFQTVFANDILKEAETAWVNYFTKLGYSSSIFRTESIVDLVKMHKASGDVFPSNIDIVTGGFPCQDFSVAGKRNGFNSHKDHNGKLIKTEIANEETRGKLYMWMKEVIEITRPKIFIAENVKGLVNLSNVKEIIQRDFSSAGDNGYLVLNPKVLHAANYGVPQSRERVIFIGIKKSALKETALKMLSLDSIPAEYDPYPKPSHAYLQEQPDLIAPQTLENIFELLKEPENSCDPSQMNFSKAKYMGSHCQGQIEIQLNNIGPTIRAEHHGNIEYRRLSEEHGGTHYSELKKGLKERRLTPRECALIQTFPVDYDFVIPYGAGKRQFRLSPSAAYKIIGNAVPPLLAYHVGKRIEQLWNLYFE